MVAWAAAIPAAAAAANFGMGMLGGGGGSMQRYQSQMGRELRNATTGLDYWKPFGQQRFADTQPLFQNLFNTAQAQNPAAYQQQAGNILSGMQPMQPYQAQMVNPAQFNVSAGRVNALNPNQINAMTSQFMNPYTQNVIDQTLASGQRQLGAQRVADASRTAGLGAFGSSGQALQDATTTSDYLRNMANLEAQLRNQGFDQAQAAALSRAGAQEAIQEANIRNQMQAGLANQRIGMQGALANQSALANQYRQNLAGQQMEMERARQLAQLGSGLTREQMQLAQVQQRLAQNPFDFAFEQYQAQQKSPYNRLAALQGNPVDFGQRSTTNLGRSIGTSLGTFGDVVKWLEKNPNLFGGQTTGEV